MLIENSNVVRNCFALYMNNAGALKKKNAKLNYAYTVYLSLQFMRFLKNVLRI